MTKKCSICKKPIKKYNTRHKQWCKRKKDFLIKYNLDKRKIQKEYDNLGSITEFRKKYPDLKHGTYKLFKELGIDYSLKKSTSHKNTKTKREKTHQDRYGVRHNFCKDSKSRKDWEKRIFEEEGIVNVFQRDSVKQKSKETIIKRYGSLSHKSKITNRGFSVSNLNKKIFILLNDLNIKFLPEYPIKKNKNSIYYYDILIDDTKKLIEINGDYWHGNPKIYKPTDIIMKNSKSEITVSNKWNKDKRKKEFAENMGYELLTIWELEINEDINKIKEKILNYAKS